jgi:hypothetical protein
MPSAVAGTFQALEEDSALPTGRLALDRTAAATAIVESLGLDHASARLLAIHILAYKPGRRCVIEYRFEMTSPQGVLVEKTVLGKIRTKRFGNSGYRQLRALWESGFNDQSSDGISVPEPLGTVPRLQMWLQQKVVGSTATVLLDASDGAELSGRIAEAVQKLHTSALATDRRHTMHDELRILERCLGDTAKAHPHAASSIAGLIDAAGRVGSMLPSPAWCPSHRDFYADQVLVSGDRLFLIDFDLFCEADPGLDVGNFLGHVTEHAIRVHGTADALAGFERALEDRFVARAGEGIRPAVRVYAALTLARHVYLCTRSAERAPFMPALLAQARERLDRIAAEGGHA